MRPEEVPAEWVELAARALYEARSHGDDEAWDEVHANVQDGTREWARAALAAVLPHYGARVLNEAREALAGKVLWGEHRSGYSGALVRLDGVPATAGTNGSIPLDHWLMHRAAREGGPS